VLKGKQKAATLVHIQIDVVTRTSSNKVTHIHHIHHTTHTPHTLHTSYTYTTSHTHTHTPHHIHHITHHITYREETYKGKRAPPVGVTLLISMIFSMVMLTRPFAQCKYASKVKSYLCLSQINQSINQSFIIKHKRHTHTHKQTKLFIYYINNMLLSK
jgi:hypothetical protein